MVRTRKGKEAGNTAINGINHTAKTTPAKRGASAVIDESEELPRKRGEAPFGGETIKIVDDDQAAAEQLETELLDSAKKTTKRGTKKTSVDKQTEVKKVEPEKTAKQSKQKAKTKAATTPLKADQTTKPNSHSTETSDPAQAPRQYWLMKAEQEDRFETAKNGTINNTKFTIDDLRAKKEPEPWDGVRNPVAAKNMRSMRRGDLAFFYASGGKAGRKPGITGIMEIVEESQPDPSVHDEGSYGYVEKANDRDKWILVKVAFRHKLAAAVSLKDLQSHRDGALAEMQLLKQMRLSVSRVERAEWEYILKNLVDETAAQEYA